jgi:hypothetical protein
VADVSCVATAHLQLLHGCLLLSAPPTKQAMCQAGDIFFHV